MIVTITFVSGPTAQYWHSLQLKQLAVKETVRSYPASLTVPFKTRWQCFVLLQETCYVLKAFGSMLQQVLLSVTGTGLTTLNSQVILCQCLCSLQSLWYRRDRSRGFWCRIVLQNNIPKCYFGKGAYAKLVIVTLYNYALLRPHDVSRQAFFLFGLFPLFLFFDN